MNKPQQTTISRDVLEQIRAGKISMRPHWHFALLGTISLISLGAITIAVTYTVNLVVYKLRLAAADRPMYGLRQNISYYSENIPWVALTASLISIGLLLWLLRKFDFSYRFGRWLLAALVALSIALGCWLAFTSFNQPLQHFGPTRNLYGQPTSPGSRGDHSPQNGTGGTKRMHNQEK